MLTKIPKATFGLQLKFADPRLYGTDRRFPKAGYASSVFAAHLGNFTALPVITVAGSSANGYTMRGPDGRSYRVTRALQANLPHVIDMAEGYLRINGELMIPQGVAFPQRWGVPYGEGITMTIEPAAGGTASFFVDLEDTWN
jgi:hypothetical protein